MRDILIEVILTVIGIVFATIFMSDVVVPLKDNQAMLAQTNTQLISTLQAEVNSGTSTTIKGSAIKSQINRSVGSGNVEIYVNGTKWDGKSYDSSNITVNDDDEFSLSTEILSGKTVYRYSRK